MNKKLSLTQIEGKDWGAPDFPSLLVTECHRLRHVPLEQLSPENLRILIGQGISLPILMPLALDVLEIDPWIKCDYYAGDLLEAVRRCPAEFWAAHGELEARFHALLATAPSEPPEE